MTKKEAKLEETRKRNKVIKKVIRLIRSLEIDGFSQKEIRDGIYTANRIRFGALK